jgi:hypothetical protein
VYWTITVPLTALILITWRVWLSLPVQTFLEAFSWKDFFWWTEFFKREGKEKPKENGSKV